MNINLPIIESGMYYVILCESSTGIVLNQKGEYAVDPQEKQYFIFDSKEDAVAFIRAEIA